MTSAPEERARRQAPAVTAEVVGQLAPTGVLRVAVNLGNPMLAHLDPATGRPAGVSVDIAAELARRLGVPVRPVTFDAAGKVVAALAQDAWDVAFLARDPARASEILFTPPYLLIEGTFLVRDGAPYRTVEELDRPGVRIAVGAGAAYDLYLTRTLKQAELVRSDTSAGALTLFGAAGLDAAAGVRSSLVAHARSHAGLRVMEGRFMAIEQAVGTPRGRLDGARYLTALVEELKGNGFVTAALERNGQRDAAVAPPARVKVAVQLGSQRWPPSAEKACPVRNDAGVRSEKVKRTKMALPWKSS